NNKYDTKAPYLHCAVHAKTASRQHHWRYCRDSKRCETPAFTAMEHPFLKPAPVCETAERAGVDNTLNKQ
ncbi:hypothetical protein, partial [Escherichia coli]|uniref:hypothetical protein n=3 Tax=Escherichia coli TaxID=562 RepID=UPI0025A51961